MYTMIICHWAILHYNMPFKTIAGRSDGVFWWFPGLSEDQEQNCWIHQNYLVALLMRLHFHLFSYMYELSSSIQFLLWLGVLPRCVNGKYSHFPCLRTDEWMDHTPPSTTENQPTLEKYNFCSWMPMDIIEHMTTSAICGTFMLKKQFICCP